MAKVLLKVTLDGQLDEDDYDRFLSKFADNISLAVINAASNVTSDINPSHLVEDKALTIGAKISVDYAQLIPTA